MNTVSYLEGSLTILQWSLQKIVGMHDILCMFKCNISSSPQWASSLCWRQFIDDIHVYRVQKHIYMVLMIIALLCAVCSWLCVLWEQENSQLDRYFYNSWFKVFFLPGSCFWGRNFLIWRREFPNIEYDFCLKFHNFA